jgi:hypothetical protein
MSWERALEADARLAAKNSVIIRAALRQSVDWEAVYRGYLATTPDKTLSIVQQRVRARSWAIINIRVYLEPLKAAIERAWFQAYDLGDTAAQEAILETTQVKKADVTTAVDWSKWKPGDQASAGWAKALDLLRQAQGVTWKSFSDTTLKDIGNSIGEAITLGLDAKQAAKLIRNHVASPARALTIAITEQNRAISMATQDRYRKAGLTKMEWLVFDPCKICAQNANVVIEIGQRFPSGDIRPPAHPNCRCALSPVIPGFNDVDVAPTGTTLAPLPQDSSFITEPTPTPQPAGKTKVEPQYKDLKDWDRDKLQELAAIKDDHFQPRKIWNGAEQQYQIINRPPTDTRLKGILEAQGFTAKPEIVDSTQMYQLGERNPRMWRGVTPTDDLSTAEMIEQFKSGDMFVGTGVIGNGVYAGSNYNYVVKYAEDKAENVMTLAFKDGARFMDYKEAQDGARNLANAFYDKAFKREGNLALSPYKEFVESFGDLTEDEARKLGWLFHEPGAFAAAKGYDAISNIDSETGEAVYVILNRGAVAIQK